MKTPIVLALIFVCLLSTEAVPKVCAPVIPTVGLIGAKYTALGGNNGQLGCPLVPEHNAEGPGRAQEFENGAIVWSPNSGPKAVAASWVHNGVVQVDWQDTDPFSYDFFIVRWDIDGRNVGQADVRNGPRTHGHFVIAPLPPGVRWHVIVEGCDNPGFLGKSTCRQGWSNAMLFKPEVSSYGP